MRLPLFLLLILPLAACKTAPGREQSIRGLDLTERFEAVSGPAGKGEVGNSFVRHFQVVRHGEQRDAILMVAPVTIRASLGGISGRVLLKALSTPVFNIGDGIQMETFLTSSGQEHKIFSRCFDPGRREQDRAWVPLEIVMDLNGAADTNIEFRISAGAQGDLTGDWLALSAPRIVKQGGSP